MEADWRKEAWHTLGETELLRGDYEGAARDLARMLEEPSAQIGVMERTVAEADLSTARALRGTPPQSRSDHSEASSINVTWSTKGVEQGGPFRCSRVGTDCTCSPARLEAFIMKGEDRVDGRRADPIAASRFGPALWRRGVCAATVQRTPPAAKGSEKPRLGRQRLASDAPRSALERKKGAETTLRHLPPFLRGKQAEVRIDTTCARAGGWSRCGPGNAWCHAFLRRLRHGVGACGALWLLLDRHGSHCHPSSLRLAAELGIRLLWLPRQHPKLNPVDHLWRSLKNNLAANRQFASVDELAGYAQAWVRALTPTQALRKAGLLSRKCWLKDVRKTLCSPTLAR